MLFSHASIKRLKIAFWERYKIHEILRHGAITADIHHAGIERLTERYKLVSEKKDWMSAQQHCNSMQAELVVIANAAEQRALARYLRQVDRQYCSSTLLSVCLSVCLCLSLSLSLLWLTCCLSVILLSSLLRPQFLLDFHEILHRGPGPALSLMILCMNMCLDNL